MKGTFPRCWKCGQEWASCNDGAFIPPEHRQQQPYNQQAGQQPPWSNPQWQDSNSGSWSPRTRTRKPNRGRKQNRGNGQWQGGDPPQHPKGHGKGQEQLAPTQVAMPSFMPFQAMMPHYPPMMMQPPLPPPPLIDKGVGKGPGSTATTSGVVPAGPAMPWGANAQMMQFPMPPMGPPMPTCSTSTTEALSGAKQDGPAQQQLNRLLKEMKKEEDKLSPHLQSIAHEIQTRFRSKARRAASRTFLLQFVPIGDAKQDLLEAENARAQMLTQWKQFIQQSLTKWREYTASFQASESAHQQGVQAARHVVRRAQKAFDVASKREQAGKDGTYTISDSDTEPADDVMEDPHGDGVQRVQDGMNSIVASLEELSSSADQLGHGHPKAMLVLPQLRLLGRPVRHDRWVYPPVAEGVARDQP